MFTIKAASELTAVPVATLRAWERRYGIALPQRTDSGYRLYDERALAEIRAMQALVDAGWAPRQAADEVLRRRVTGVHAFDALVDMHAGLPSPEALVDAAAALDDAALTQVLDAVFSRASFEHVLDTWLSPALHLIGTAWQQGRIDIAGEHFVSAEVMRRLAALYEATGTAAASARVLIGLPEGGEHEIPSLAFAVLARQHGINAVYIGADVPAASWAHAVHQSGVSAVVMSATTARDAASAQAAAEAMLAVRPELCIAVGGAQSHAVNAATLHFTGDIPSSVRQLHDTLSHPATRK